LYVYFRESGRRLAMAPGPCPEHWTGHYFAFFRSNQNITGDPRSQAGLFLKKRTHNAGQAPARLPVLPPGPPMTSGVAKAHPLRQVLLRFPWQAPPLTSLPPCFSPSSSVSVLSHFVVFIPLAISCRRCGIGEILTDTVM